MCFSAEASFGVAAVLLPVGAYCVESAWRKDRAYLALAGIPLLFGLQQSCEGVVWVGVGRADPGATRPATLAFLFFALALWPAWVPLAVAAVERRGGQQLALVGLAGFGALFGVAYYLPVAAAGGRGVGPAVVGHSLRYDLSAVPAVHSPAWWVWPAAYLAAVCVPLSVSRDRHLRPLAAAVVLAAVVAYALFEAAFASVWCFLAAAVSAYLAWVLHRLPGPAADTGIPPQPRTP